VKRLACLVLSCLVLPAFADEPAVTKSAAVRVTVDTSEVPELKPWADEAKALVETWHPKIAGRLKSDGFTPSADVTLVFKKDMEGVAGTLRNRITIASAWVKQHPEDKGMVIHELTHVIQAYPPSRDGWLVEGIADYIRFYQFEPQTKLTLRNPERANYREGYRTAAMFLDWAQRTYDAHLVDTLNAALREGRYRPDLFEKSTSKSLDALWAEFVAQAKKDRRNSGR